MTVQDSRTLQKVAVLEKMHENMVGKTSINLILYLKLPGSVVIKLFSCSTQLRTKFQLLIKAKIPTNEEVSCFKSLRCCIYHANKC